MNKFHGPFIPPSVWLSEPVQSHRKKEFLADKNWEVLYQSTPDRIREPNYLLVKKVSEASSPLGIVAMRYLFGDCGYLAAEKPPSGLLASGQWADYKGKPSLEELINDPYLALGDPTDDWDGIREIRPEIWFPKP